MFIDGNMMVIYPSVGQLLALNPFRVDMCSIVSDKILFHL